MKRGMAENIGYAATPVPNGSKTPSWGAFLIKAAMVASGTYRHSFPLRDTAVLAFDGSINEIIRALTMAEGTGGMRGVVR